MSAMMLARMPVRRALARALHAPATPLPKVVSLTAALELSARLDHLRDLERRETRHDIEAHNTASAAALRPAAQLIRRCTNEAVGYCTTDGAADLPEVIGAFTYYSAVPAGVEDANIVYYRQRRAIDGRPEGEEEVVVDMNALVRGGAAYAMLGTTRPSPDPAQRFVAYTVDTKGDERYTLHFRDMAAAGGGGGGSRLAARNRARRESRETADNVTGVVWAPYRAGEPLVAYYTTASNDQARADTLWRHVMGTACADDIAVFHEPDATRFVDVVASKDGHLVTLSSNSRTNSRVFVVDFMPDGPTRAPPTPAAAATAEAAASPPPPPLVPIEPPGVTCQYFVTHTNGVLLCVTNADGAENYSVLGAPVESLGAAVQRAAEAGASLSSVAIPWMPVVPHHADVLIHDIDCFRDFMVVFMSYAATPQLLVVPLTSGHAGGGGGATGHVVALPPTGYSPTLPLPPLPTAGAPIGGPAFFVPLPAGATDVTGHANADNNSREFGFTVSYANRPNVDFVFHFGGGGDTPAVASDGTRSRGRHSVACIREQAVGLAPTRPLFAAADYTSYVIEAPSGSDDSFAVAGDARDARRERIVRVPITITHRADIGIDVEQVKGISAALCEKAEQQAADGRRGTFTSGPLTASAAWGVNPLDQPSTALDLLRRCTRGWDDWHAVATGQCAPAAVAGEDRSNVYSRDYEALLAQATAASDAPYADARVVLGLKGRNRIGGGLRHVSGGPGAFAQVRSWLSNTLLAVQNRYGGAAGTHQEAARRRLVPLHQAFQSAWLEHRGGTASTPTTSSAAPLKSKGKPPALTKAGAAALERALFDHEAADEAWRHYNPTLLHVYGAYGQNVSPDFEPHRLPALSRGWVMAFAHVRGGCELGKHWHVDGMLGSKRNTFLDAVAAARTLIAAGLTQASLLASHTESAGGLASGWLVNSAPRLLRAHVMRMPFLDISRDLADPSLPLTQTEYEEWGAPGQPLLAAGAGDTSRVEERPTYTDVVASYDPCLLAARRVLERRAGAAHDIVVPDVSITSGLQDVRTPPYHALKFLHLLRQLQEASTAAGTDGAGVDAAARHSPLLIGTFLEDAGHFGQGGRDSRMETRAQEMAFLHMSMGLGVGVDGDTML